MDSIAGRPDGGPPRRCGIWRLLADTRRPGRYRLVHFPCGRKGCGDCGPARQAHQLHHWMTLMDGYPMRRRTIAEVARRATLAKLRRDGHQWLPIPAPDGTLTLYATGGPGEPVDDLEAALAADLAASPPARRIRPSQDWAVTPKASRGPKRWQVVGDPRPASVDRLTRTAMAHGIDLRAVPDAALSPSCDAALDFQQPDDAPALRHFTRDIGLRYALAAERPERG
jgi:hypothetical protein